MGKKRRQNRKKGFALVELIVVIVIILILSAVAIPLLMRWIEKSLEATDMENVRSAYTEVVLAAITGDKDNLKKTVQLQQNQDGWQGSNGNVTIAGVSEQDTDHWIGNPVAHGECGVYYDESKGIVLNWKDGNNGEIPYPFDINENLQQALIDSGLLDTDMLKNNTDFELDARCTYSIMVPEVLKQMGENSLLQKGTWGYYGNGKKGHEKNRYLYWTSVNTDEVGADKRIPALVQTGDGKYYVTDTTTIQKGKGTLKQPHYVAITNSASAKTNMANTQGKQEYRSLEEAYKAYQLVVKNEFPDYINTLPY